MPSFYGRCVDLGENHRGANRLQQVCERLRGAHVMLNLEKCQFARDQVEYLGHVVTREGARLSMDKVRAI
jgi:hypothetical protein